MTPRECALEIEPGASPARLHEIETALHKFAHSVLYEEAIDIDNKAMSHRISYAWEAARLLRDHAHEHLNQT